VYIFDFTPPPLGGGGKIWPKGHLGKKYEKMKKGKNEKREKKERKERKEGRKGGKFEETRLFLSQA
jgi:hypothetical protein